MSPTRLHSLHPRTSLRKLRTAFTPTSPTSPSSTASQSSTSPLSATTRASSRFSGFNFDFDYQSMDTASPFSPVEASQARRVIRRKKSMVEAEQEEERLGVFRPELTALVEPRPRAGVSLGGIEEVLEGRV